MEGQAIPERKMEESLRQEISSILPVDKQSAQLNRPAPAFPRIRYSFNKLCLPGHIAITPIGILFAAFYLSFRGKRLDGKRSKGRGSDRFFERRKG
jgi:hypothetical protein